MVWFCLFVLLRVEEALLLQRDSEDIWLKRAKFLGNSLADRDWGIRAKLLCIR
jgi:hypothetical protein